MAHSGPEAVRHHFNAEPSQKDLEETYLPAFEAAVKEAGVSAVMGAYNEVDGVPCCASSLIRSLIRDAWNFQGMQRPCPVAREVAEMAFYRKCSNTLSLWYSRNCVSGYLSGL